MEADFYHISDDFVSLFHIEQDRICIFASYAGDSVLHIVMQADNHQSFEDLIGHSIKDNDGYQFQRVP